MAADTAATIVRVRAVVEGLPGLNQLKTAMRGISAESKSAGTDLRLVNDQLKSLKGEVNNSVNNLRLQVQAFQAVRNSARIGSEAYKDATLRLKELNRELDKAEGRRGGGDRLAGIGAVAGAGFFGGPEALLGSAAGLAFGGVGGAYAGAAIGAQVAQLRKAAMDAADYSQQLAKLRLALQGVVGSSNEYNQALAITENISQRLNIPIGEATRGFTRLTAAVVGAGGNVSDAEVVFKGVASAIKATGGSAEDVQGGLVAMSQVFSKGKLSAEELSGQLGERLPGAVTLFAKATGRNLPQLQKDLEQGVVGLNDVMKFSDELVRKYAGNSDRMARSTEESGARMKVALDKLKVAFGDFFKPIKIEIDNLITKFAELVAAAFRANVATREANKARAQAIAEANKKFGRTGVPTIFTLMSTPGYEEFVTERTGQILAQQKPAKPEARPKPRTKFEEPSATGVKDKSDSILRKLQSDFERSVAVLGRQFNVETRKRLLNDVLAIESKINNALLKGQKIDVDGLRLLQQKRTLEITRDVLINEETALEEKIAAAKSKGVDLTNAQNRLGEIRNEREQTVLALTRLQNDELRQARDLSKQIADALPTYAKAALDASMAFGSIEQQLALIAQKDEAGVQPLSIFSRMSDEIKELQKSVEDLEPRLTQLAGDLSAGFGNAFSNLVFSAQSARDSLAQFFGDIAKSFQNMVVQMIADYLRLQIMTFFKNIFAPAPLSVAGNYFGGGAQSMFTNPSFGVGTESFTGSLLPTFAMGGVMTSSGAMRLKRYAGGGIANSPQLAMFGEGSRPEAYVPLPDGRTIPVTMKNGGGTSVVVNVDASGSSVQGNQPDANALGRVVGAAVQAELIKQKRPGGLLA